MSWIRCWATRIQRRNLEAECYFTEALWWTRIVETEISKLRPFNWSKVRFQNPIVLKFINLIGKMERSLSGIRNQQRQGNGGFETCNVVAEEVSAWSRNSWIEFKILGRKSLLKCTNQKNAIGPRLARKWVDASQIRSRSIKNRNGGDFGCKQKIEIGWK